MLNELNVREPAPGTARARVKVLAEELTRELGRLPTGAEVGRRFAAEGGNPGTAETQYSKWIKDELRRQQAGEAPARGAPRGEALGTWLTVSPDGQVTIPPDLLTRMRLDGSRKVRIQVLDGEANLASVPVALERVQRLVRSFDTGVGSAVDELIAERRAEAARESEE